MVNTVIISNNIIFFRFLNVMILMCCLAMSRAALTLSERETVFIQKHAVSEHERLDLDRIFSDLDSTIQDLFIGKNLKLLKSDVMKLLRQHGFFVYAFHYKPLDHPESDRRSARLVVCHQNFPGYFLKIGFDRIRKRKNIARVAYSDLINDTIDRLKLAMIGKIEKKLYHRIGQPDDLVDFNYIVVVPKITGRFLSAKKITHDERGKRVAKLFFPNSDYEKTYEILKDAVSYSDEFRGNFMIGDDGKLYIIDTEPNRYAASILLNGIL